MMNEPERKLHSGAAPCFTFKEGEIKYHESIVKAGEELGCKTHAGSHIRNCLRREGFYRRPKTKGGAVAWLAWAPVPEEAKDAYDVSAGVLW